MKVGIIVFPGSNCDRDVGRAIKNIVGTEPVYLWHQNTSLEDVKAIVVPGGFSYGDYLRCGAIAKFSAIMKSVVEEAKKGLPILGICNGFQILTEAGLLDGVLMRNKGLSFICDTIQLKLESTQTPFTKKGQAGHVYNMPIAHMEGNYFADEATLKRIEDNDQVIFRYCDANGNATTDANPNGTLNNIAGICNKERNIMGMMPHPERVCEEVLGGTHGRFMFESLLA